MLNKIDTTKQKIYEISEELEQRRFKVAIYADVRSCFDILAKKDEKIFLIKIYEFVEALNRKNAIELRNLATYLLAIPYIISKKAKNLTLSDNVVYNRYDLPVVTKETFMNIIDGKFPYVYAVRGNYCVDIDTQVFSEIKNILNITLEQIAKNLEVSTQAVYRYKKQGRVPINVANKLVEIFGKEIINGNKFYPMEDIRRNKSQNESQNNYTNFVYNITKKFFQFGFDIWEGNSAFNVLALNQGVLKKKLNKKNKENLFIIIGSDPRTLMKKIDLVEDTIKIIHGDYLCIGKHKCKKNAKFLSEKEIEKIDTLEKFIEIFE